MTLLEPRRLGVVMLGLFLTSLAGCALSLKDPFNDRGMLKETQKEFSQYLRWGAIEKASMFVVADQRAEFERLTPHLSELRITDYEMIRSEQVSETEASLAVRYRGYSMASPVERTIIIDQTWTLDPESNHWMVRLEVSRLRRALGLAAR
jgi:hypothetical protein